MSAHRVNWVAATFVVAMSIAFALIPSQAKAACNVIPSAKLPRSSTLGSISHPFALPGQHLTVFRDVAAFSETPAMNTVSIVFEPPGGPTTTVSAVTVLAPDAATDCGPSSCAGGSCTCIRFEFPDTDGFVGAADDGMTLTGPARIEIATAGSPTATIDVVLSQTTNDADALVSQFVALPPITDLQDVVDNPGSNVLGAPDAAGNVFVPVSYESLVGEGALLTRFVEVTTPLLAAFPDLRVDALTAEGVILPPVIRRIAGDTLLGTTDAPSSILRIEDVVSPAALVAVEGKGPIVLSGVDAFADPAKRADIFKFVAGDDFAVYENRECGIGDVPASCMDLNDDGDQSDYFLQALDLTTPQATPVIIDSVEGEDFGGYPGSFPLTSIYAFTSSDSLVEFRIPEPENPFPPPAEFDLDGNGVFREVVRSGAFDLTRNTLIAEATDSERRDVAGDLLVFSLPIVPPDAPDGVLVYEADLADPGPFLLADLFGNPLPIFRDPVYTDSLGTSIFDVAYSVDVIGGESIVGFVIDEAEFGGDLNGDGLVLDALVVGRWENGDFSELAIFDEPLFQSIHGTAMQVSSRYLVFQYIDLSFGDTRSAVVVYDGQDLAAGPTKICTGPGVQSYLVAGISDTAIPCLIQETAVGGAGVDQDLNGDGDFDDDVLHVYLPQAPGGPVELNLGLAVDLSSTDVVESGGGVPFAEGPLVVIPVSEEAQGVDLDGDGFVGPTPSAPDVSPQILHVFNATTETATNYRARGLVTPDFARFLDRGMSFMSFDSFGPMQVVFFLRTFLRDIDGDLVFEELGFDAATGMATPGDNCPGTPNPLQEDANGNGIGDACEPVCIPGNCNGAGGLDAGDPVCTVLCVVGAPPVGADCACGADCNCSGALDAADPICSVLRLVGGFMPETCP